MAIGFDDPVIRRLLIQTLVWLVAMGALLFGSAGTLDWPQAWVLLLEIGVLGIASGSIIARRDPDLVRERMRGPIQKDQKPWDKALLSVFMALVLLMPVAAGIDAVRLGISHMPLWLHVLGALGIALGTYILHLAMIENSYATTVVRVQDERGQHVISSGPYAYVRHPMYAGAIPYFLGMAFLLGSWWAVGIALVIIVLFAVRAVWEEETLKHELAGYSGYAGRVRARLIPWIW